MKRIKRILFLLLIFLFMVQMIPVSAEDATTNLTKAYKHLSTYLYTPYYRDSVFYESYTEKMETISALLKEDNASQETLDKHYAELKHIYAQLVLDSFDYSELNGLIESFQSLDSVIFSEKSWEALVTEKDAVEKELSAPSLFRRNSNTTKEMYAKNISDYLAEFTQRYRTAYNNLELLPPPEKMTKEYLSAYINFLHVTAREELLGNTEYWSILVEAFEKADSAVALNNPRQDRLDNAYHELKNAYKEATTTSFDISKLQQEFTLYHSMSASKFSESSWKSYAAEAEKLESALNSTHFFFIPIEADKEICKKFEEAYFDELTSGVKEKYQQLVPNELYIKLSNLCANYKTFTTIEGVELKQNALLTRVREGEVLLQKENATPDEYEAAIKNIENAAEDLKLAETFLLEEQVKTVKHDTKTVRIILIFSVSSLVLSAGIAILLSKKFFGRVNWSE